MIVCHSFFYKAHPIYGSTMVLSTTVGADGKKNIFQYNKCQEYDYRASLPSFRTTSWCVQLLRG